MRYLNENQKIVDMGICGAVYKTVIKESIDRGNNDAEVDFRSKDAAGMIEELNSRFSKDDVKMILENVREEINFYFINSLKNV